MIDKEFEIEGENFIEREGSINSFDWYAAIKLAEGGFLSSNVNNNVVAKGICSGTFVGSSGLFLGDILNHELEYIGAPCGTEDNGAKSDYLVLCDPYKEDGGGTIQILQKNNDYLVENVKLEDGKLVRTDGKPSVCGKLSDSKDLVYSKLSNVNINNDSNSTFVYKGGGVSCKDNFDLSALVPAKKETTYRPLPSCLTIKESNIEGLGLFASKNIYLLDVRDNQDWCSHVHIKYNPLGGPNYEELIRTVVGGKINHSNNPNCTIQEFWSLTNDDINLSIVKYSLRPLRDIKSNEEILVDYRRELCGLTGYEGAEFLKRDIPLEDRVYINDSGCVYSYDDVFGKFTVDYHHNNSLIFYTPEDAEKYLQRIK